MQELNSQSFLKRIKPIDWNETQQQKFKKKEDKNNIKLKRISRLMFLPLQLLWMTINCTFISLFIQLINMFVLIENDYFVFSIIWFIVNTGAHTTLYASTRCLLIIDIDEYLTFIYLFIIVETLYVLWSDVIPYSGLSVKVYSLFFFDFSRFLTILTFPHRTLPQGLYFDELFISRLPS